MDGFTALLREDAAWRMPPRPAIVGAPAIGRVWFSPRGRSPCAAAESRLVPTHANGRPAVAIYKRGDDGRFERFAVMLLEVDGAKSAGFDAYVEAGPVA